MDFHLPEVLKIKKENNIFIKICKVLIIPFYYLIIFFIWLYKGIIKIALVSFAAIGIFLMWIVGDNKKRNRKPI